MYTELADGDSTCLINIEHDDCFPSNVTISDDSFGHNLLQVFV